MLLQELVEYSYRLDDVPPAMYNNEPVYYWIELDAKGGLLGIVPVEPEEGKRPKKVSVPSLVRSAGVKAKLLADNAEYVLGLGRETSKPERVTQCHQAFVELVERCADDTGEISVQAVAHFLQGRAPENVALPDGFDGTRTMAFHVDGTDPMQLPSVQSWWKRAAGEGQVMQCLVCGNERPAMERLQIKLKGIPGGQASGLAIISANEDAYLSYGLEASYTAPTCQDCSDRFMKSANALVADANTRLRIGHAVYAFWTREATSFQFAAMFARPEPQQVRALLERVWRGGEPELDPTPFYARPTQHSAFGQGED